MHKHNIDLIKKFMPDFDKKIYPALGCSIEKIIADNKKKRVIPQHILRDIASYPSIRSEYVIVEKVTQWILARVNVFANKKIFPLLDENAIGTIEPYIYKTLHSIFFRTHTYDYNKSRISSPGLTPQDYARKFDDSLEVEEFFRRYSGLADIVINQKNKIVSLTRKILIAYHRDIDEIKKTIELKNNIITKITMGMGDSHNNGNTVTLLHLNNEKLLYKPSDGRVNTLYTRFAEKFSATSGIEIYTPKVILRDNWHWCEYIQHAPCTSQQELNAFYEAIGAQIMLVYALNGYDMHYENVIAMGKHPVIIDLECLFSATSPGLDNTPLADSVLSTGMLPTMSANHVGRYITAISAIDNKKCSYRHIIEKDERGFAVLKRENVAFEALNNIPRFEGEKVTAGNFSQQILHGFSKAWDFVKKEKDYIYTLIAQHPSGINIRKLYHSTEVYSRLLSLSYHPRFLQDKASRALCLLTVLDMYEKYNIARKSYKSLLNGDIPAHTVILRYPEKELNAATNDIVYRLRNMTDADFHFQKNVIRLAVLSLHEDANNETKKMPHPTQLSTIAGLQVVESVFDKILNTQFQGKYFCYRSNLKYFIEMQGSLYSGTAGLAFISLCLYSATQNKNYIDKAISLTDGMFSADEPEFGGFVGDASYAYILELLYTLTGETHYLTRAINMVHANSYCTETGKLNEFLNGHAGCMVIALNILRHDKHNPLLLSVVHTHLKSIIDGCKNIDEEKISWDQGLTGFSHGNAGIIYALGLYLEQCGAENKETISEIIRKAINYENTFKTATGWKDLRVEGEEKDDSMYWCNGAPGIALSRHKVKTLGLPAVDDDLTLALALIDAQQSTGEAYSLCHSPLSNLLIKNHISGETSRALLSQNVDTLLREFDSPSGHQEIATLGKDISLMTGISGVLYTWLWLHFPVPFILTLAPCPDQAIAESRIGSGE